MVINVYTLHPGVVNDLLLQYSSLFLEKPCTHAVDGSYIWYQYDTRNLKHIWKRWIKAAKLTGLIYDGNVH